MIGHLLRPDAKFSATGYGAGNTVEDRVITASVKMIRKPKKKGAELTEQLMLFYAVFEEDVPIPIAVMKTLVPSVVMNASPSDKTGHATRTALTTLLKYNLLKGETQFHEWRQHNDEKWKNK